MPKPRLKIIIASTRPGRVGLPVGRWIDGVARAHGGFDVELLDLAVINLPFLDEPNQPRLGEYTKEHTRAWSATISAADAFVIVTPEYNHAFNAPMKNALDFLFHEWAFKPVGFVSYGGIAAGTRALQMLKQVIVGLRMVPLVEAVSIASVHEHVEDGVFTPTDQTAASAGVMLNELVRWAETLAALRNHGTS